MLHGDTKKLGRIVKLGHRVAADRTVRSLGAGCEMVFVAVDDHSRVAYAELAADETVVSAITFLRAAVHYYAGLGISIRRISPTTVRPSSPASSPRRSATWGCGTCAPPYTPRTNGKAERFIQSALREWAYAFIYRHSRERADMLHHWLHHYNWHRPHSALKDSPPVICLNFKADDLLTTHMCTSSADLSCAQPGSHRHR